MDQATANDRYVSFCGINCDNWADELIAKLKASFSDDRHHWQSYFNQKFTEQATMGHNNLFFVGAQMNNLYTFFNEIEDEEALALLWKLEQECC